MTIEARIALYLDVENLVHDRRAVGDWDGAAADLLALVDRVSLLGTVVARVAACDREAARRLAPVLAGAGVRTFIHRGGQDAADRILADHLSCAPASCNVVVIASGDHYFAEAAAELRRRGKHVAVAALFGSLSAELYVAADEYITLTAA